VCDVQAANIWPAVLAQLNPIARTALGGSGIGIYNTAIAGLTVGLSGLCCWICLQQRRHIRNKLLPPMPEATDKASSSETEQTAPCGEIDIAVIVAARN